MSAQLLFLILYTFFAVIIFPITIINFLILKTPLLSNVKSFVITSGSMEPIINEGSLIYTIKKNEYLKGDIVTFSDSIGKVTHRVVNSISIGNERYYVTKGDANRIEDMELIPNEKIYGEILSVIPHVGNMVIVYKSPPGILVGSVASLSVLIFIVYYYRKSNISAS